MDDDRIWRVLRQHVRTDQLFGVEAVPVGEVCVEVEADGEAEADADAEAQAIAPAGLMALRSAPEAEVATRLPLTPTPTPVLVPSLPFSAADAEALPPVPKYSARHDRNTKVHLLHGMDVNEVRGCVKCGLCKGRTQTVFGDGDPDAKLMFIGEGPGENEDLQGKPFVGRAGQKLEEMIKAMGLSRATVFIANIVKCRPPENRPPQPNEVLACWDYLKRQIETIQPRVIVTLGGPATKQLLATDRGITAIRGIWHHFNGLLPVGPAVPVMPTFHPSYLLRVYTPENRKKVWSDLQRVMKMLAAVG